MSVDKRIIPSIPTSSCSTSRVSALPPMIGIHGLYYFLPIVTFSIWTTNIVGLLGLWSRDHFRRYKRTESNIVFISDVGAVHQTFFIIFCSLTAAFYILTTLAERHLRHQRRIPGSVRRRQTYYDIISIVCATIGSAALILLSVFGAFHHSKVHWSMTIVFILFVALSVLFQTLEVFSLSKDYSGLKTLKVMVVVKAIILTVAIAAAIAFGATYLTCNGKAVSGNQRCNRIISVAAICEWAIAFLLALFFLTYIVDLWPARSRASRGLSEDGTMVENKQLAKEHHIPESYPTAPYAIDGIENNDTMFPSQAAQQQHEQEQYPQPQMESVNVAASNVNSPILGSHPLNGSEHGSLHQPPVTQATVYPNYPV